MERKEWLDNLKIGDEVALYDHNFGYKLQAVKKKTPTGRIVLNNELKFDTNGSQITSDIWSKLGLFEPTKEILEQIELNKLVFQVKTMFSTADMAKFDLEDLKIIQNILIKYKG